MNDQDTFDKIIQGVNPINSLPEKDVFTISEKWNGKQYTEVFCHIERSFLELAEATGVLLTLVNHDWIFVENENLFKQKLQGITQQEKEMKKDRLKEKMKEVLLGGQTIDWVALGEFLSIWENIRPAYAKDHENSIVVSKLAKMRDVQREVTGFRMTPYTGRKVFIETFTDDVKKELGI